MQLSATDWINLLQEKRPNTNSEQQNWLLTQIPSKEVAGVLDEGIAIPNEILEDKDIVADYQTLEKLSLNLLGSKENIAIIFTKSMDGLNIDQARQILLNMHGEYSALVKDQPPSIQA